MLDCIFTNGHSYVGFGYLLRRACYLLDIIQNFINDDADTTVRPRSTLTFNFSRTLINTPVTHTRTNTHTHARAWICTIIIKSEEVNNIDDLSEL